MVFFNMPFSVVCPASIHAPLARTLNYKGGWETLSRCGPSRRGGCFPCSVSQGGDEPGIWDLELPVRSSPGLEWVGEGSM